MAAPSKCSGGSAYIEPEDSHAEAPGSTDYCRRVRPVKRRVACRKCRYLGWLAGPVWQLAATGWIGGPSRTLLVQQWTTYPPSPRFNTPPEYITVPLEAGLYVKLRRRGCSSRNHWPVGVDEEAKSPDTRPSHFAALWLLEQRMMTAGVDVLE
jgi:hypothetical protein